MSLLRAARGGVIEDLTVDWGVQDPPSKEENCFDDDFEMISGETASTKTAVNPPAPAPISLFDTSTPSTSGDLGPKKMIIHLAPPPRIQQAPKSDKLPIPLYPGFRCSVFSIIKVSGQSSFSSCVRINGRVMGSPVTLELPVTPIALDGGAAAHLTDVKVKLLHSLAARTLIQDWEDKEKTEKNRAEIERLGKRYSLASSATSFLAIDDDTKKEMEKGGVHYHDAEQQELELQGRAVLHQAAFTPQSTGFPSIVPQSTGFLGGAPKYRKSAAAPQLPLIGGAVGSSSRRLQTFSRSPAPPPPPPSGPPPMQMADHVDRSTRSATFSQERSRSSAASGTTAPGAAYSYGYGSLSRVSDATAREGGSGRSYERSLGLPRSPPSHASFFASAPAPAPVPASAPAPAPAFAPAPASYGGNLTVESIARAQQFDGGFPVSSDFVHLLTRSPSVPALPRELAALDGSEQEKQIIWVTVLVLAVLAKKFAGDKDSWEMLAEKSTEFVETRLVSLGLSSGDAVTVIHQLKTAAARYV